jgi:molybdopterin molybdotransferase
LAGIPLEPLISTPVRSAFTYEKKAGRREYLRAKIHRAADGVLEAAKFPRDGAGLLSSLVETDGLVELSESTTSVDQGQTIVFLPYSLIL